MHGTPKLSYRLTSAVELESVQQAYLIPDPAAAADANCTPLRAGLRQLPGLRVERQNLCPVACATAATGVQWWSC